MIKHVFFAILEFFGKKLSDKDTVNRIPLSASREEKAKSLLALSKQNEQFAIGFLKTIDQKYGSASKYNTKQYDRILQKSSRPSIRDKKPWFDVEHIRDAFRFKTALSNLNTLPGILKDLKGAKARIIKAETSKMLEPQAWGWRAVMYDLRMKNGQLVEYYLSPYELIDANEQVCHELYERWRNQDVTGLTTSEIKDYQRDLELSYDTYDEAFAKYLNRTNQNVDDVAAILASANAITS